MNNKPNGRCFAEKIWNEHVVSTAADGRDLLFLDRHILHEVCSPQAVSILERDDLSIAFPELTFATVDHIVQTDPALRFLSNGVGNELLVALRGAVNKYGFNFFDLADERQGIVHVTMPEHGVVHPGMIAACGDSHTSTLGAIGCLGLVVSISEIAQILSTQTVYRARPKFMRVELNGRLPRTSSAKDIILWLLARLGVTGAKNYIVEFCGSYIENLSVEGRFTLCNMTAEMGAVSAIIPADAKTVTYLKGANFSPAGEHWEEAAYSWLHYQSDSDAQYDADYMFDVSEIEPQITWGTSPNHVIPINGAVPTRAENEQLDQALNYMGLVDCASLEGLPINTAFIGSCTNGRFEDLLNAANVICGRKIAPGVRALVVPGSASIKRRAETEGLDKIFTDAGFEWHFSGCSMCAALNNDDVGPFQRSISTSNRNFPGRQGKNSRTHLASPMMVATSALYGCITDPRKLSYG